MDLFQALPSDPEEVAQNYFLPGANDQEFPNHSYPHEIAHEHEEVVEKRKEMKQAKEEAKQEAKLEHQQQKEHGDNSRSSSVSGPAKANKITLKPPPAIKFEQKGEDDKDEKDDKDSNSEEFQDEQETPEDNEEDKASLGLDDDDNSVRDKWYPPEFAIHANSFQIEMLTRKPGDRLFSFWFIVSTYTPTILACLGPLANMISIAAIVDPWREAPPGKNEVIRDETWILVVNILSLVCGFSANILLVLNFTGKIRYTFAQISSIIMWFMAAVILTIDLILVWKRDYFAGYYHSGGFYFGCFTCGIYFLCFLLLLLNYLGFALKEYDSTFNLDASQRGLMIHTVLLGVWLVAGSGMFSRLIGPMAYSTSMYFSATTILTIGLGDIVPITSVARALSLAFTFFGVLELGLVIAWLRSFVLSNIGPTLFWHRLEQSRKRLLKYMKRKNIVLNGRESFEAITRLRMRCELKQRLLGLVYTMVSYIMFWLMGALVFCKVEGWTYFDATYFCFLCLLTTGYGDYAPKTSVGRSFFVIWAVAAIPMMTILISSLGDALFAIATHIDDFFSNLTGLKELYQEDETEANRRVDQYIRDEGNPIERFLHRKTTRAPKYRSARHQGHGQGQSNGLTAWASLVSGNSTFHANQHDDDNSILDSAYLAKLTGIEYRCAAMKVIHQLLNAMNDDPDKIHSFEEWAEIYYLTGEDPMKDMAFLEDESPLRYPLKECSYMVHKVLTNLEERTQHDVELRRARTAEATGTCNDVGQPEDSATEITRQRSNRSFKVANEDETQEKEAKLD